MDRHWPRDDSRLLYLAEYQHRDIRRTYRTTAVAGERLSRQEIIIMEDLSAKSHWWGATKEDARGTMIVEWIDGKNLNVVNRGNAPTFIRGSSESCIDLTLCSTNMLRYIKEWKVSDRENLSDHRDIEVTIDMNQAKTGETRSTNETGGWRFTEGKMRIFEEHVASSFEDKAKELTELAMESYYDTIIEGCNKAFPKKFPTQKRKADYWWTAAIRAETIRKRRVMTRMRNRNNAIDTEIETSISEYKDKK